MLDMCNLLCKTDIFITKRFFCDEHLKILSLDTSIHMEIFQDMSDYELNDFRPIDFYDLNVYRQNHCRHVCHFN
jgi:hypothetical protein